MPELPIPPHRSSWARCWLEGAGAAILLEPGLVWSQLSRTHIDLYHRLLPLNTVARALAIDLLLLSLLAMLAIRLMEKITLLRGRFLPLLWALWFGLLTARGISALIVSQVLWWQVVTTGRVFLLTVGAGLFIWLISRNAWDLIARIVRFSVMVAGFCIFWMVPQLIVAGLAHQPWDRPSFQKPVSTPAAPHARIVWLLFDEMSYDQVFVHRWPGLELPNLDRLRSQSITFSDVQPDGFFTEDVIPSLLLGEPIDDVRGTSSGWMLYQSGSHAPWQPFDGRQTLFADARRASWTTGAVGSYNPYCRILTDQLDFCWMALPPLPDHLSRRNSTLRNVLAPLSADWRRLVTRAPKLSSKSAVSLDALGAVRAANVLIGDPAIDLCFVHLPMPHPPGGYNRRTGHIGPDGSYVDNLALSDRVLGQMLADIAASPAAGRTTLILSSDHSWRTFLWRHAYGWTHEDELASDHGAFDPRPMLMVRFPAETAPEEIDRPVPLLGMHNLVERMMAGKIANPEQLETWAGHP